MSELKRLLGIVPPDVHSTVMAELSRVRQNLTVELQRFEFSVVDPQERGKRLLYLFQTDLLPGINAMIIESKGKRDLAASIMKINPWHNALAWAFVLCLNVALLFYIYLFAIQQSAVRQQAWFQTFMIWLFMEIFIVSSIVVIITHVIIPSLTMGDLRVVKNRLKKTIREYRRQMRSSKGEDEPPDAPFNSADYFFVSTRLATRYPDLLESRILARFITPWPHQSYQRTRSLSQSYSKKFSTLVRAVATIIAFLLKGLLSMPPGVQDSIVSLCSVVTAGNLVTFLNRIYTINPILVMVPVFIIAMVIWFVVRALLSQTTNSSSAPQPFDEPVKARSRRLRVAPIDSSSVAAAAPEPVPSVSVVAPATAASDRLKSRKQSVLDGVMIAREISAGHQRQPLPSTHKPMGIGFPDLSSSDEYDDEDNHPEQNNDIFGSKDDIVEPLRMPSKPLLNQHKGFDEFLAALSSDEDNEQYGSPAKSKLFNSGRPSMEQVQRPEQVAKESHPVPSAVLVPERKPAAGLVSFEELLGVSSDEDIEQGVEQFRQPARVEPSQGVRNGKIKIIGKGSSTASETPVEKLSNITVPSFDELRGLSSVRASNILTNGVSDLAKESQLSYFDVSSDSDTGTEIEERQFSSNNTTSLSFLYEVSSDSDSCSV